jgi:hypothetical protein
MLASFPFSLLLLFPYVLFVIGLAEHLVIQTRVESSKLVLCIVFPQHKLENKINPKKILVFSVRTAPGSSALVEHKTLLSDKTQQPDPERPFAAHKARSAIFAFAALEKLANGAGGVAGQDGRLAASTLHPVSS